MGDHALVLNASFEPLNVVSWQKAIQLLYQGKVEVLEESHKEIRSVRFSIRIPAVVRLIKYVSVTKRHQFVRFSRANVFLRDRHCCQYCGKRAPRSQLTLDHVTPSVQAGKKTWENIVTACKACNQKKGGRTPQQAGMRLVQRPTAPTWLNRTEINFDIAIVPQKWKLYLSE